MTHTTERARLVCFVATFLLSAGLVERAPAAAQSFQPPPGSFAMGWKDKSGDLPGMYSADVLVIGAVAAAVVLGIVMLTKKRDGGADDAAAQRTPRSHSTKGRLETVSLPEREESAAPKIDLHVGAARGSGSMPALGLALGLRWSF